jgi:hypothetical protein
MKRNNSHSKSATKAAKPVVTLDECSVKYSQKITAKKLNQNVKGNLKLLKNISFS